MTPKAIKAIAITILLEGGGVYTNIPGDPGGETKFGLSKAANPDLDIKNLTVMGAEDRYFTHYWDKNSCELLNWPWCGLLFDAWVNPGPGRQSPTADLQEACGTPADGYVGTETIRYAQASGADRQAKFLRMRLDRMLSATNAPKFHVGWEDRLFHLALLVAQP
jgi:lysozyme family protein